MFWMIHYVNQSKNLMSNSIHFKDADALDRFRLGPDGLGIKFLRTEEARHLVDFAKELLRKSSETNL